MEGVATTRPELRRYYDLTLWVETSGVERQRRQLDRNENSLSWLKRWAASETYYFESIRPQHASDMIVAGE